MTVLRKILKKLKHKEKNKSCYGHIDSWNGTIIFGWAIDPKHHFTVGLDIYVNETFYKSIWANDFREDIKVLGMSPHGKVGFHTELNIHLIWYELFHLNKKVDCIRFFAKNNKTVANNIPIISKEIIPPDIIGEVNSFDENKIVGWCLDKSYPEMEVKLDLYLNGQYISSFSANLKLKSYNQENEFKRDAGFEFDFSNYVDKFEIIKVQLKLAGTNKCVIKSHWTILPLFKKINSLIEVQNLIKNKLDNSNKNLGLEWLHFDLFPKFIKQMRENSDNTTVLSESNIFDNSESRIIDIIIPVYKGYEETLACINSVLASKNNHSFRILIINDNTPDIKLCNALKQLQHTNIILLENNINQGFVFSVNRGMKLNTNNDVLLLNSDTLVADYWLDRIVAAAYSDSTIGTVTPLSNNASICSYPVMCKNNQLPYNITLNNLNEICGRVNDNLLIDLPTAHGFCMFIKRALLNQIGYFDEKNWGKGYGEENDFSLRAAELGWRNVLTGSTFVQHLGSVSFESNSHTLMKKNQAILNKMYPEYIALVQNFIYQDPPRILRHNISLAIFMQLIGETQQNIKILKSILFVSHSFGGGTSVATFDLATNLSKEGIAVFLLTSPTPDRWQLSNYVNDIVLEYKWPVEKNLLVKDLQALNIVHIHYHHTVQFFKEIWSLPKLLNIKYDVSIHDYYMICPKIDMMNESKIYCNEPPIQGCEYCIKKNGIYSASQIQLSDLGGNVKSWRQFYQEILCQARRVFVPSVDTEKRVLKYFELNNVHVKPHLEPELQLKINSFKRKKVIKVAFIGAINDQKGQNILYECAKHAFLFNMPIQFIVLGYVQNEPLFKELPNVIISGQYQRDKIIDLLIEFDCQIAALLSITPETFSYTLSESLRAGLIPLYFKIGAINERLNSQGIALELNTPPWEICEAILNANIEPIIYNGGAVYSNILKEYYGLEDQEKLEEKII